MDDQVEIRDAGVAASLVHAGARPVRGNRVFSRADLAEITHVDWTADTQHAVLRGYIRVKDVSEYACLPNLESLHLNENHLTSCLGISRLTRLRVLSIRDNYLSNLLGIEGLPDLHTLYVDHVKSIVGLKDLPALADLDVSTNDFAPLLELASLVST